MAKKKVTPSKKRKEKITTEVTVLETVIPTVMEEEERTAFDPIVDPRQALFLEYYYDQQSPTWGNAMQSAIRAGYSETFAHTITYKMPKWWLEFIGNQNVSGLIEKHITETLSIPVVQQAMGAFGPIFRKEKVREQAGHFKNGKPKFKTKTVSIPVMVTNLGVVKEKTAIAKLAAPAHDPERYGKKPAGNKFIFNIKPDRERFAA